VLAGHRRYGAAIDRTGYPPAIAGIALAFVPFMQPLGTSASWVLLVVCRHLIYSARVAMTGASQFNCGPIILLAVAA